MGTATPERDVVRISRRQRAPHADRAPVGENRTAMTTTPHLSRPSRSPRLRRSPRRRPAGSPRPVRAPSPPLRVESAERLAETADRLRATYRSPTPPTSGRRLAAACVWALVLAVLGSAATLTALVLDFGAADGLAAVLGPIAVGCGLTGVGLTTGAFLTIGHRRTPWALLGAASVVMLALLVTVTAA